MGASSDKKQIKISDNLDELLLCSICGKIPEF